MRIVDWVTTKITSKSQQSISTIIALNLILAFLYFGIAKLGLNLASINNSASPVWPATGFAFSIVYLFGYRTLIAVALGAFAANTLTGGSLLSTLTISLGNTAEAIVGAIIIRRIFLFKNRIGPQTETLAFFSAASFGSLFSASIGVLALYFSGEAPKELIGTIWLTWWVGDFLGGLVVAPILIKVKEFNFQLEKWGVLICLLFFYGVTTYFVFFSGTGGPFLFVLFPMLLYSSRNLGTFSTLSISGAVCIAGVIATFYGVGPFAVGTINERLIHLQIFLAAYTITALVLSNFGRKNLTLITSSVLLFCWMLSGIIFYSFDRSETQATEEHFASLVNNAHEEIHSLASSYEEVLRGGVGLFLASKTVEYEEWKSYNKALEITNHHIGMNGLGVIWPVDDKDIIKFQNEMIQQGLLDFEVHTVPGFESLNSSIGKKRYIIKFIEPINLNFAAIGLDTGSEPNRRLAADTSRDLGVGVLSSKIILVQDQKQTPGSLYFLPIYQKAMKLETIEDRRKAHIGWVYSPIIYENFFLEIFKQTSDEIELQVLEEGLPPSESQIFSNLTETHQSTIESQTKGEIGKKSFIFKWSDSPKFVSSHDTVVAWVGLCGALSTLLLAHLLIVLQTIGSRSREIAEELTRELSKSREKFQEGERRLLYALDGSNDGIWDWNIGQGEMYVSGKIAETHGWPQTFQAKTIEDLKEYAHPEDLVAIGKSIHNLLKGISDNHEVETRYRTLNGQWRWVLTRGKVSERDSAGKPTRMTGVHIDIHDLKDLQHGLEAAQYKLTNIANSVPTKISLWNKNLICEFANDLFAQWLGVDKEKLIGSHLSEFIDPEYFMERMPIIQRALDGETFKYDRETVRPSDNQKRHIVATYLPNRSQGILDGFFLFLQDITDLKKAEIVAVEERKVALEATAIKSQFLANMSHEIRTPLNGIIGMTKLLNLSLLDTKQKEYSNLISQSSDSLLNLINDILDFSKVEAGKLELEYMDFSLKHLISSVCKTMTFAAKDKNINLEMDLSLGANEYFRGDPSRIRQILTNLISNAIKFTPKGSVEVRVRGKSLHGKSFLKFEVIDTGIGIATEDRSRLFDSFSQADSSTTRKFGGTGLGLSISKQLVQLMDGEIGVESSTSGGSNFWFSLELENGSVIKKNTEHKDSKRTLAARILVVEDNRVNQMIAIELLENAGYLPHAVGNGIEAIEALREIEYDLVLMDCQMPVMDGFEATKVIRKSDDLDLKSIPIVAMTANAMDGDKENCISIGMNDYVSKPIDERELMSVIERNLIIFNSSKKSATLCHILVVEDNKVNQNVISLHLDELGYSYDIASNGLVALEYIKKNKCDLILMDCQMPEMDGFEATQKIRMISDPIISNIPIVALTANALAGDREKCLDAGMDDYLTKPIDVERLEFTLKKWNKRNLNSRHEGEKEMENTKTSPAIDIIAIDKLRKLQKPNKPDLLTNLINLFFESAEEGMDQVRSAVKNKDLSALSAAAHSLKSSSANLGAKQFSDLCFQLEKLDKEDKSNDLLEDLLTQLELEYSNVLQELENLKIAA